jgi:hypothetical protein
MARPSWKRKDARQVQRRLNEVVEKRHGGVKADFEKACKLSHDTAVKWFGVEPRVPDSLSLFKIARGTSVSLDWLVLGRQGANIDWPQSSPSARQELYDAIVARFDREYSGDAVRREAALSVLSQYSADQIWDLVVRGGDYERDLLFEIAMMERMLKN